ncbi:MAG: class I SAM-dependent methyltransferase [Gemmatimonadota bacterium]|nr:class I SAM-dependent methyltransferase [Gemmatimonadota bacterium]
MSWYEAEPSISLALLQRAGLDSSSAVIDVGGGASTLVDELLARAVHSVTVLDIAGGALETSRARLGASAGDVTWREADVLTADLPPARYDLWHDRAVFHFLTTPAERIAYVTQCTHALREGGALVMGAFADDGPTRCSGLNVVRYNADTLAAELGAGFELRESLRDSHRTPDGVMQSFLYTRWIRT